MDKALGIRRLGLTQQQNPDQQSGPKRGRPRIPVSYGIDEGSPAGLMDWDRVSAMLSGAHNYWVATTRADGRPHAMPVWGIWLEESFYFATDRASRKGRNLAANPALVVHLESGDNVVIVEGAAEEVTDAAALALFAQAYEAKYQFRPDTGVVAHVVYRLRPQTALSWLESEFTKTATRWLFSSG